MSQMNFINTLQSNQCIELNPEIMFFHHFRGHRVFRTSFSSKGTKTLKITSEKNTQEWFRATPCHLNKIKTNPNKGHPKIVAIEPWLLQSLQNPKPAKRIKYKQNNISKTIQMPKANLGLIEFKAFIKELIILTATLLAKNIIIDLKSIHLFKLMTFWMLEICKRA